MKLKIDPLSVVIVSILLGWGWTELTTEPVCQKEVIQNDVKYTIPVNCSVVTAEEVS